MLETRNRPPELHRAMAAIGAVKSGELTEEDALSWVIDARSQSQEASAALDEFLLTELSEAWCGLQQARESITAAQEILDQYGAAPLIPALFLSLEQTRVGKMAVVATGGGRRVVAIAQELKDHTFKCGDWVLLDGEQGVLSAVAGSATAMQAGETACFERYLGEGRAVVKSGHDDQIVAQIASSLADTELIAGDIVRWDRVARLVLERIDRGEKNPFLVEQISEISLECVGGAKSTLERLQDALINCLVFPERSRELHLDISNNILLEGPPGNGKTYLTKVVASQLRRLSGRKVYFSVVNGSSWSSPYVGMTETNIAALFTNLRNAAEDGSIAVLFIDEIEAVGRTRGSMTGQHADRALATLLTQLDGFLELANVSVVAACNRKDLLDPALFGRFGDVISVLRPNMIEAGQILKVHLPEDLPYAGSRDEMIDFAISLLYAPNADTEICEMRFRDGKVRTVNARELVSARFLSQIAQLIKRRALMRWNHTGTKGIQLADFEEVLFEIRERLCGTLTPQNAHNHLNLAMDEVVLSVEPIRRRVARTHLYLDAI